jgi:hypothetical protein
MSRTISSVNIRQDLLKNLPVPAPAQPSLGTSFLLSIAGIFSGNEGNTSEHVHEIVSDCITKKLERRL